MGRRRLKTINKNKMKNVIPTIMAIALPFVLIFLFLFVIPWFPTVVKTYEQGVVLKWGKIQEQTTGEGLYWRNPIATKVQKIDMRERVHTLDTSTVSKEGLKFGVKITVRYQVRNGQAVDLVQNLQTPLNELILTYANATIDDVATGKDKNEMYSDEGRVAIVQAVKEKLNSELGTYAIINQVVFEDIDLPSSITDAIQKQQAELEKIKQKENQKEVALREADIRRIEAQGIADANAIIQKSLTPAYLTYEAIQKFNPSAEKIYVATDGVTPVLNY